MARSSSYGEILRSARKRSGMNLADAAYRLRIRPDILRAIEECDYARMPPRGYTRNMISSYARLLGLNSREITQMYLDGAYAFEVGRVRTDTDRGDARRGSSTRTRSSRAQQVEREPEPYTNARGRTVYEDRTEKISRPTGQARVHSSRNIALPSSQYTNLVASPKANGGLLRLPYLIAVAVIVILLIIIAVFAFGGNDEAQEGQTPNVPVAGMTDTSNPAGTTTTTPQVIDVKPTSAIVSIEVASGETSYLEVYVDDVTKLAESVTGPSSKEFEITGTCRVVTTNPSATTVLVDGEAAEPLDEDGDGVYILDVDFAQILADWEANKAKAEADAAAQQSQSQTSADADSSAGSSGDDSGSDTQDDAAN